MLTLVAAVLTYEPALEVADLDNGEGREGRSSLSWSRNAMSETSVENDIAENGGERS